MATMSHAPAPAFLNLFPKQMDVFNVSIAPPPPGVIDIVPRVLVSGGRMTGKTIAIVHRIMRHLWETPSARAAVFSRTIKLAKEGGIWQDVMDAANEWVNSGLTDSKTKAQFAFTSKNSQGEPGARIDSQTRTISFSIRNRFGGESELKLFSLEHDHEVEAKVKSTRFSLMWFSELSNYDSAQVVNVSYLQLRMKHLKPWQHLWIADTNPHEEGDDHWIYKVWYKQRLQDEKSIREELSEKHLSGAELEKAVNLRVTFRKSLCLIEIFLPDNIYLPEGNKVALMEQYSDDEGEYSRNVDGLWVKGHGRLGCHFSQYFHEHLHIVGSSDPNDGDRSDLGQTTVDLITGWDIGDVNHSFHVIEDRLIDNVKCWIVHEEHVCIGQQITVAEFTIEVLEKMMALQSFHNRSFPWKKHWSDSSSTNVWRSAGDGGSQAVEVEAASAGRIILDPVRKPKNSVRSRVRLIQFLLRQGRLFVSHRCRATIEMLYHCKRGSGDNEFVAQDRHKHPFDSLSYPIYEEMLNDPDSTFNLSMKPMSAKQAVSYRNALRRF